VKFDGKYRYVARGEKNNGIRGYITENIQYLNDANTISFGQDTATMFYQDEQYFTGDKIKVFRPKKHIKLNKNIAQLFIATMQKSFSTFSWGSSSYNVSVLSMIDIQLPIKNGKINFSFIEKFIAELEAERIAELEAERIAELEAYLVATNLKDYTLTTEEEKVLDDFENGKIIFNEYRIEDVLQWQPQKEIDPLKLGILKDVTEPLYPFYGQATVNNGIISYNQLSKNILNNKDAKSTILIHSNNQNIVYLETPFYLKDGHGATSVLQCKELNKINQMFIVASIDKVIKIKYSYNNKATKIELKNSIIELPSNNNQPAYQLMETFISAIQKLVIKDVVLYANTKISTSKEVVNAK